MIRLLLALTLLAPTAATAKSPRELLQEGHVRVRVGTEPARQVVIGQQTRFFVEILTDTWFTKAPTYPELVLEGAVALMPEQLGTNFTERIEGETFAAQRRSYVIFPQRAGVLEIPSLRVRVGVAQDGGAGSPFTLRTRPVRLQVVLPAEAEGVDGLVTTPQLRVEETWNRSLDDLQVGDAIERRVTLRAEKALGMLLPDLVFTAPEGIAAYADPPRTADQVNRGQYRGERSESVTYVLQRAGEFTIPAIELPWWNPAWGSLQNETLKERTFTVRGGPAPAEGLAPPKDLADRARETLGEAWAWIREHLFALSVASLVLAFLVVLLRRLVPAWRRRLATRRARRRTGEPQLFREAERGAARGDGDAFVDAYWRWLDALRRENPSLTTAAIGRVAEDTGFREGFERLGLLRYRGVESSPEWATLWATLRAPLRGFRAGLLATAEARPGRSLSGLNPER